MVLPTFTLVHSDEFCFSVSCGGACCRSCGFRTGRIGGCGRCAHHVYIGLFALTVFSYAWMIERIMYLEYSPPSITPAKAISGSSAGA